ncbi:MAG TPA: TetR/AcrR family transcriptional regulator [Moraxellaceae bacterium]|nr:TetR/AcrR family transcriptional regulator [Moraxellaceae bacterium]
MKEQRTGRTPQRTYGGESPEERMVRRRASFIAAGRVLFSQIGYRKTTMRGLCAEAGLTDRYFYESFETIEDLLVAVYEELMGEMQGHIVAALQVAGPGRDADALIDIGLDAFFRQVEDTAAARVIWLEVLGVSPRVDQVYNHGIRGFAEFILVMSRTIAPHWPVSDEIARVVAMGMIGAASEAAKDWLMSGYQQPRAHLVQGIAMVFKGILLIAKASPPPAA